MPNPVRPSEFCDAIPSANADLCTRFSKLLNLYCAMLISKAKVLLIDELENGLYYSILPQIWRGIATLAESEQIQVFATTHSRECILAAH